MITAETITDEQIRELRTRLLAESTGLEGPEWLRLMDQRHLCGIAIGERRSRRRGEKREARAKVAEILNKRGR